MDEQNHYRFKELHQLLVKFLPPPLVRPNPAVADERLVDTITLSTALGVSRYSVYRALNEQKLSVNMALNLIDLSGGKLTPEDLLHYVIRR